METEIEAMTVRLLGDGSDYQTMMEKAQATTKQVTSSIDGTMGKVGELSQQVQGYVGTALTALGALGARNFLESAFSMYAETEVMQLRLKAAIEQNGRSADGAMESYKQFAVQMRNATGTGLDATTHLLQMAETQGIFGDAAERAVKAAIGLSASLGGDASSYIRVTQAIETGNAAMLGRIPALRGIHGDSEKLAKAQDLVNKSFAVAEAIGSSSQGVMNRYHGTIKAITKQFGEMVSDAIKPTVVWVTQLLQIFLGLDPVLKKIIVGTALVAAALLAIGPAIGSIAAVASPIWTVMTAGWGLVATVLGALTTTVGIVVVAAVAAAALIAAVFVTKMGGLKATWEKLQEWGAVAWRYIKGYTLMFWDWAKPYVDAGIAAMSKGWDYVSSAAATAWDWIQEKVSAFWSWARPIAVAGIYYLAAVWEVMSAAAVDAWNWIQDAAASTWNFISDAFAGASAYWQQVWRDLTGGSQISWQAVQDYAVEALARAEFGIRNLRQVFNVAWLAIAAGATTAFNTVTFFFTDTVPALLGYLRTNWMAVWRAMFEAVLVGFEAISFNTLIDLLMGNVSFDELRNRVTRGLTDAMAALPSLTLPSRVVGGVEEQLLREFRQAEAELGTSWDEFVNDTSRWNMDINFPALPNLNRTAADAGRTVASSFNGAAHKEFAKFDAVSIYSAEAASRMRAQMDRFERTSTAGRRPTEIPVVLLPPVLPQVDVPGHSLYPLYMMPIIEIPTALQSPVAELDDQAVDVLGRLLDGGEENTSGGGRQIGTVGTASGTVLAIDATSRAASRSAEATANSLQRTNDVLSRLLGGDEDSGGGRMVGSVASVPGRIGGTSTAMTVPTSDEQRRQTGLLASISETLRRTLAVAQEEPTVEFEEAGFD